MNTLFNNPREWTKRSIGTRIKYVLAIVVHLFAGIVCTLSLSVWVSLYGIQRYLGVFLLMGYLTVMPVLYMYALKRLFNQLEESSKRQEER